MVEPITPKMSGDEMRPILIGELHDYFLAQGFRILAAEGIPGIRRPSPLANDGYGDQENKVPDIVAYDPADRSTILGIARTCLKEIDSESSQTEYNVFLDQKDPESGRPYKLYVILPSSLMSQFSLFIHHYIHYEYWYKIIVMPSRTIP